MAFVPVTSFSGLRVTGSVSRQSVCHAPARAAKWTMDGKGFGGGEATRDPEPTNIDPEDPKGKQKAIHPAEDFATYTARIKREKEEAAKAGQ